VTEHARRPDGEVALRNVDVGLAHGRCCHPQQDLACPWLGLRPLRQLELVDAYKYNSAHALSPVGQTGCPIHML
jgi:hypothetical protein